MLMLHSEFSSLSRQNSGLNVDIIKLLNELFLCVSCFLYLVIFFFVFYHTDLGKKTFADFQRSAKATKQNQWEACWRFNDTSSSCC